MADNIAITPGSGVTIAADDIGSALYQRIKISNGADGSATDTSTASPLPTRGVWTTLVAAPTVTAGAYSANDVVGGLLTFANAVRATGGHGMVHTLILTDLAVNAVDLNIWFYDTLPATIADNAAFDIPDAELPTLLGAIAIRSGNYLIATDNQTAMVLNTGFAYNCTATTLYAYIECVATPTYDSTADLTLTLQVEYLD